MIVIFKIIFLNFIATFLIENILKTSFKYYLNLIQISSFIISSMCFLYCFYKKINLDYRKNNEFVRKNYIISLWQFFGNQINYLSLNYINYSIIILLRASKIIIVLLYSTINKGTIELRKLILTFFITTGILIFSLDKQINFNNTLFGIIIVLFSMTLDIHANYSRKKIFQIYNVEPVVVCLFNNFFIFITSSSILYCLKTEEFYGAIEYLSQNIGQLFILILYSILFGIGQILTFQFIKDNGYYTFILFTLLRKLLSALFSIHYYHNGIKFHHFIGVLLVGLSVLTNILF